MNPILAAWGRHPKTAPARPGGKLWSRCYTDQSQSTAANEPSRESGPVMENAAAENEAPAKGDLTQNSVVQNSVDQNSVDQNSVDQNSLGDPATVGDPASVAHRRSQAADPENAVVDKSGSRVREMFRQIAPRYDLMNHLLSLNTDRYWRWRAVRRIDFLPDFPVLDTCTGTGDLAISIAKKSPDGVNVVGSDFCPAMLEIARSKTAKDERPVEFLEADSQSLPFADDSFQAVTVAFGLRNVADTDQGLREMHRVCRPGGKVMVLEFSQPRIFGLRQLYGFYFKNVLPRVGQWFARNDKSAYNYLPESVGQFPDGQALADRMLDVGLVDVKFKPLTFGIATIYEGLKPKSESDSSPRERVER